MITLDAIIGAYHEDDPFAHRVVWDAAHYLGVSLANLVGPFNLEKIVITSEMARCGESWLNEIEESMHQAGLTHMVENTRLEIGKLDLRSTILGAAAFLLIDDYSLLFIQVTE